jgi:glutaminyl-peptide cyclotransferase
MKKLTKQITQKKKNTPKPGITLRLVFLLAGGLISSCSLPSIQEAGNVPTAIVSPVIITPLPTATIQATDTPAAPQAFDGQRAMQDVETQLSFGPRTVGGSAHQKTGDWIAAELERAGWQVKVQETTYQGHPVRNIIGKWGEGRPWVTLSAHYDSRLVADHDPEPEKQTQAVPGANDGASGVAVLLELARVLPAQLTANIGQASLHNGQPYKRAEQIWLVFLDAEDNGKLPGWDWILGSRAFVESLQEKPDAEVNIDMIGDKNLNIPYETNSNMMMNQEIWAAAAAQGYFDKFIPQPGRGILDDHRPFLEAGIPAVDIIDFDYPYYHTTADSLDKVSAESMKAIGETLIAWLKNGSAIFNQP